MRTTMTKWTLGALAVAFGCMLAAIFAPRPIGAQGSPSTDASLAEIAAGVHEIVAELRALGTKPVPDGWHPVCDSTGACAIVPDGWEVVTP